MVMKSETIVSSEASKIFTPAPSIASASSKAEDTFPQRSSIPWPGSTYIIEHVATARALTFSSGSVVLRRPSPGASIRWKCVSKKGWIGFQDPASGMFLGHNKGQNYETVCMVREQNEWENFCVRQKGEGEYVLLQQYGWKELRPVGVNKDGKLAVMDDLEDESTIWRFIKVANEGAED